MDYPYDTRRGKIRLKAGYETVPILNPRTVKMSEELRQALIDSQAKFKVKFGRDPGGDDPVLWDPTDANLIRLLTVALAA